MKQEDYAWVLQGTEALFQQLVNWRRHFHRHPELGFAEHETGKKISGILEELGAEVFRYAKTGVAGVIKGGATGPCVALRADMDALPVLEETGVEYASRTPGVMHACGHDAHMAITLGVASLLAANRNLWQGAVKFIFQPAEECPPGGAKAMIEEGVLQNPDVKAVLGLHVFPGLPTGTVGIKTGTVMAAADNIRIMIQGQSGHGAAPHQTVDAVVTAAQAIMALQTIASRKIDPLEPVVVTVGSIHGGTKCNVIASEVELLGTVRTLNPEVRKNMPKLLRQILDGVTAMSGAAYQLDYTWGYPPTVNDEELVGIVREAASQELGSTNVVNLAKPSMGGEDFAYFAQTVPGIFVMLGSGSAGGDNYPWHHARFNIDEQALQYGVRVMTRSLLQVLRRFT